MPPSSIGTIFGPGPLFALLGNGVSVTIVALGSALAGTWFYGFLRLRLPN